MTLYMKRNYQTSTASNLRRYIMKVSLAKAKLIQIYYINSEIDSAYFIHPCIDDVKVLQTLHNSFDMKLLTLSHRAARELQTYEIKFSK